MVLSTLSLCKVVVYQLPLMRHIFHSTSYKRGNFRFFSQWEIRAIHGGLSIFIKFNISYFFTSSRFFLKSCIDHFLRFFYLIWPEIFIKKLSWSVNVNFVVNGYIVRYLYIFLKFYLWALVKNLNIDERINFAVPYLLQLLSSATLRLTKINSLIFVVKRRTLSAKDDQFPVLFFLIPTHRQTQRSINTFDGILNGFSSDHFSRLPNDILIYFI